MPLKAHGRYCRGRRHVCRKAHVPPLCALGCPRFLGFGGEANRVATDQEVRRKTVTGRQTKHNLSYLGGITDLFPPIRFQALATAPTEGS